MINKNYAQPPLCFYQKIINDNNFNKIYILSNGHENPVVDRLLNFNPKIEFKKDSLVNDISKIISAYNFVISQSTFAQCLIRLNDNLKNLYIYKYGKYHLKNFNCTIHEMQASKKYKKIMFKKWKNTKEQLDLMLNETCFESKIIPFISSNYKQRNMKK